jgi:cytochrome b561
MLRIRAPFRSLISRSASPRRVLSTTTTEVESYSTGVQFFHWVMGGSVLGAVGFVLAAQNTKDKELKGKFMFYHKSCGTLAAMLLVPRLAFRLTSKIPGPVPGATQLEHYAGAATHYLLYGFLIFMPVSGVAMGYFGGNGMPFFYTTFKGLQGEDKKPAIAKKSYEWHKVAGQILEYIIPLHVGGALYHVAKGQTIFPRILGVVKSAK